MVELLSAEAVAWMCALDGPEQVQSLLDGSLGTDTQQAVVLRLCETVAMYGADARQRSGMSAGLAWYDPDEQATICAVYRRACGGALASLETDDPLEQALFLLAAECAGAARVPSDEQMGSPWPSLRASGAHPSAQAAKELIRKEADDSGWLTGTGEYDTCLAFSAATTGRGGSGVQLVMAVEVLLTAAVARWSWHGPDGDTGLLVRVREVVADFRRLLTGRTANVPALLGVTGIDIEVGETLTLPWGTLRSISESERRAQGPGFGSASAVIEFQYPVKVFRKGFEDLDDGEMSQLRQAQEGPWETARRIALAGQLCASELELPEIPRIAGTFLVIFDPASHMPHRTWPFGGPSGAPLRLADGVGAQLAKWATIVEANAVPAIALGTRRTVLASQRLDPVDAFVDTIIAWENLFGSRQGDATLRVAASFANLLSEGDAGATDLFKQARDLYGLRSEVVHGSKDLDPETAWTSFQQSFGLLRRALRRLYTDRQDLLRMDSGQRSQRLLLRSDDVAE